MTFSLLYLLMKVGEFFFVVSIGLCSDLGLAGSTCLTIFQGTRVSFLYFTWRDLVILR